MAHALAGAKDIEPDRVIRICRVDVDHVSYARFGDVGDDALYKVAVGIDYGKAAAGADILDNHVFEQRALPHASPAHDVLMKPPVLERQADPLAVTFGNVHDIVKDVWHIRVVYRIFRFSLDIGKILIIINQ